MNYSNLLTLVVVKEPHPIHFLFGLITSSLDAENSITKECKRYLEKDYRSKIDNTLQPYIVKLPENYDKQKKYPLIQDQKS